MAGAQEKVLPDVNKARTQVATGELDAANLTLESSLLKNPQDAEAWIELGSLQAKLGRYTDAETSLRRATAVQPENARAHYTLGLLMIANPREKLDWPAAVKEFQTAVGLQPQYSEALTYLGAGLIATGKQSEALPVLQRAVAADPHNATAFFNLALGMESTGRDSEAKAAYEEAIRIRKTYPEASSALGKLEERVGDLAAAEQQLRAALRSNPDLQDAHQALGRILRAKHMTALAHVEFALAVAIGQREPDAIAASQLSNGALKEAGDGHLVEAAAMLRRAVRLRPDSGVAHYNSGLLLADLGDRKGAIRELSIAVSLLPAQGRPYFDLGRVLELEGRFEEAISCLRWAEQFHPVDSRVATALRKLSPTTFAGPPIKPRFGAESETAASHIAFADSLHRQSDFLGEAGELLHALSLGPASVPPRVKLAEAYRLLNEPEKANQEATKILLIDPKNDAALGLQEVLERIEKAEQK